MSMEYFWERLSRAVGPISVTVQCALVQTKFIHAGLVYLDDTTINYIESDIRRLPRLLNKSEEEVAAMLGGFQTRISEFRFLTGERCVLKMIAAKVKELGFEYFFNPDVQIVENNASNSDLVAQQKSIPEVLMDPDDILAEVMAKIFSYYDTRREHDEEEEFFFQTLKQVHVTVGRDQNGDMARVTCPFCDQANPTTVIIRRDRPGTWKVSNFSGHIKNKHNDMFYPGKTTLSQNGRKRSYTEATQGDMSGEWYCSIAEPEVMLQL
ncbi:uncharacterized protein LOC134225146 [Armigeres subalbatus]|uniref:uncharacterized protein LOC134225146 n=1 Tax=Armigeres subalbatus TaxID=124917 RepID=UPI002ED508EA